MALLLIDLAESSGFTLHVARRDAPDWLLARAGDRCVVHRATPAEAIGVLPVPQLCWVDADPNWFTVDSVLRALAAQARRLGQPFPVTLVEGAGWPHGRRDSYDDPAQIPEFARRPHQRTGLLQGQNAPAGGSGLFRDRYHAVVENEPQNGVLTAVEDFCLDHGEIVGMLELPGFGGLAAIWPREGAGSSAFDAAGMAADALAVAEALEATRLEQATALAEAADRVARAESLAATWQAAMKLPKTAPRPAAVAQDVRSRVAARVRRAVLLGKLMLRGRLSTWRAGERQNREIAEDLARLKHSQAFDERWYLARYPDVASSGTDPAEHYLRHGAAELRDPGPHFSTAYYVDTYPDVAESGINPLLHYLASGAAEGRNPGRHFDSAAYLAQNSDVAAAGLNPLEHYIACGRAEGRRAPAVA